MNRMLVIGDAGRGRDGSGMEKRDCEIFHSYQPVWNTSILPILWGDNLIDNYDVINLSSAHLAKLRGLLFLPHLQRKQQHSQVLASGTKWMSKYTPINYALFSAECRSETPNASPARALLETQLPTYHHQLPTQPNQYYDVCARVAGGSNAGHTIVVEGKKYKFHLLPSGILNEKATCVVGNGVVIHIPSYLQEIEDLTKSGIDAEGRILISDRAHIVFDFHQQVDGLIENKLGRNKIGTTKKGIGPAYASKISRNGIRIGDLQNFDFFEMRFRELTASHMRAFPGLEIDVEGQLAYYRSIAARVGAMTTDTIEYTNDAYDMGKKILIEGANATMLDIDFGTYPYVTSSNPSIGSVLTGLGVSPKKIHGIYGTTKAYCTRVGEGPFPTELEREVPGSIGEHLGVVGAEWGTTTGRSRRVGWLDIPQMKYSTLINGFTSLNLTKLDVLTGLAEVKIGRAYKHKGKIVNTMPSCLKTMSEIEVIYETVPGWSEDISKARNFEDLPVNAQRYVLRVQELLGVPIRWIGCGPNRLDMIDRGEGWDLSNEDGSSTE